MYEDQKDNSLGKSIKQSTFKIQNSLENIVQDDEEKKKSKDQCGVAYSSKQSVQIYNHILSEVDSVRSLDQMIQQLKCKGIKYDPEYKYKNNKPNSDYHFSITSIKHTKHYQITTLKASFGPFSQTLNLYNTFSFDISSIFQDKNPCEFPNIHPFIKKQSFYIAKSLTFSSIRKNTEFRYAQFLNAIKQFCITKIMSVLKIGPRVCDEFGFDLFVSQTDAFFILELCKNPIQKPFTQKDLQTLKRSLIEMHKLSILHRDIKTGNIMYSESYKKYVFIDFGLSEYRNEKPGELSLSIFRGTFAYCTQEMKKVFQKSKPSWIDLYLNDAYGLSISNQQMENMVFRQISEKINEQFLQMSSLNNFYYEVKFKFMLFQSDSFNFSQFIIMGKIIEQIYDSLMRFLYEIQLTQKIRQIYQCYLEPYASQNHDFDDLKEVFEYKIYFQSQKRKRSFSNTQLLKISLTQKFYQQFEENYSEKITHHKMSIQKLEKILFNKEEIKNITQIDYQKYLVQYVSLKRIGQKVPMQQKIKLCKAYLTSIQEKKPQKKINEMLEEQILLQVFHYLLSTMSKADKIEHFSHFLRVLQNYFILTLTIDPNIIQSIEQVIQYINELQSVPSLTKIQLIIMLMRCPNFINNMCYTIKMMRRLNDLEFMAKETIRTLILTINNKQEYQVCHIYMTWMQDPYLSSNQPYNKEYDKQLQQINTIKFKSEYSFHLLNFIRYTLLIEIQDLNKVYIQKKQIEQIIFEDMIKNQQINSILMHFIPNYYYSNQLLVMQRWLNIFDNCIQLKVLKERYFIFQRLQLKITRMHQKQYPTIDELPAIMQSYNKNIRANQQYLICFIGEVKQFLHLYITSLYRFNAINTICLQIYEFIRDKISETISLYESFDQYQFTHFFRFHYVKILERDIQLEVYQIYFEKELKRELNLGLQQKLRLLAQTKSLPKIINIDRSNFPQEQILNLIYYDIIWLRHTKGQQSNRFILDYMHNKKQMMKSMYIRQSIYQADAIKSSLDIMLYFLLDQKNKNFLIQALNIVQYITQNKFTIKMKKFHFNQMIFQYCAMLGKLQSIFNLVVESCIFYKDNLTFSKAVDLSKIYIYAIDQLYLQKKNSQFSQLLLQKLDNLKIKEIPIFCIFLMYCLRLFDRKTIIKTICRNLRYINKNGLNLILCRFYKELLKMSQFNSFRKKKYLMRKDIRYPSAMMKTLLDMKIQLNIKTKRSNSFSVSQQILESKLIKLGKCCQNYSPNRSPHVLKQILKDDLFEDELANKQNKGIKHGNIIRTIL